MNTSLPQNPSQLRRVLAIRMGLASFLIAIVAGGISYFVEWYRVERVALERAEEGARHFELQAARLVVNRESAEEHVKLSRLVERDQVVAVRVFGADKLPVYESWGQMTSTAIEQIRTHEHTWPLSGTNHKKRTGIAGIPMIQVVLPLVNKSGKVEGYLESISQLDAKALRMQREQIRNGALTAFVSVLLATILLYPLMLALLARANNLARQLLQSHLSLLRSLGNAIAKRDSDTDAHNYRVTLYAVALAEAVDISRQKIAELVIGAFLHDVGKIGISDSILLKPGKLTVDEFEIMKTHVLLGIEIVADNSWLEGAKQVIRHHHERFDGDGYPDRLAGESIPLTARIFAVADVFDALTSVRPYKSAMSCQDALTIVCEKSDGHFDPRIVAVFSEIAKPLYDRFGQQCESELHDELRQVVAHCFNHQELA